jgi:hypothetical protein
MAKILTFLMITDLRLLMQKVEVDTCSTTSDIKRKFTLQDKTSNNLNRMYIHKARKHLMQSAANKL